MQSKLHEHKWTRTEWSDPGYGPFPTAEPTHVFSLESSWSDDLIENGNTNASAYWRGIGANKPSPDVGGNFWVVKRDYSGFSSLGDNTHFSYNSNPFAEGTPHEVSQQWIFPEFGNTQFPDAGGSSVSELQAHGTTAIARTAPTKPTADLGTFLGELREGFPRALGLSETGRQRALRARNAGDEYLNVEFGWKPLVRDVRAFANAVRDAHASLSRYRRNSGTLINKRYDWPVESDVEESESKRFIGPLMSGYLYAGDGPWQTVHRTRTRTQRRWFTATYEYFVPPMNTPQGWLSDANKLLGARLTPNMLWNLAPWSWAADWVGNFGDIAANVTYLDTDSLVIHHAYVMEETKVSDVHICRPEGAYRSHPGQQFIRQEFVTTNKRRIRATPYGFGLSWDSFTEKQLGILGALGVSRGTHL